MRDILEKYEQRKLGLVEILYFYVFKIYRQNQT